MFLTAIAWLFFYIVLSWPLNRMWWGNVGDELLVGNFLANVLLGNPLHDFYYSWLPNFYPPFYFWATGILARPFAHNAIVATKIGISGVILFIFVGVYYWQKFFWHKINKSNFNKKDIISSAWFWFLVPFLYMAMLNFDAFMLKPYEVLSALCSVILIGLISRSFYDKDWSLPKYLFFGISAGLLFLVFYFWWIILIPVFFYLLLSSGFDKKINFKRLIYFSLIVAVVSSVFWGPLFYSYIKYGIENGQAFHFVVQDFYTFIPFYSWSWLAIFYLLGVIGLLIYRKKSFIKASLSVLLICYFYQFFNLFTFYFGNKPIQSSKPFLFLGTATVAVGLAYLLINIYYSYVSALKPKLKKTILIMASLLLFSRMPFVYFIDDPVVLSQIEKDLVKPQATIELAEAIQKNVPDYSQRTWLSSGSTELGLYLPLSYYIANSQHFSHQAALYSERMEVVEAMSKADSPENFMDIIDQTEPKIDTLIFYYNPDSDQDAYYTLFFWLDNFPNGGKDAKVYLPKTLIIDKNWDNVYNNDNWLIFIKK